jgi:MarR family transcriptional regulator, lower aerobic nicotinate degradation pathway regulator
MMCDGVNLDDMAHVSASISAQDETRLPYGLLLARLGQESTARFRRALRPLNLAAQQFIVMKQLEALGPSSQAAVADGLGIDYSNLAGVTSSLYERGLIERARDESDRRRYVIELTGDGRRLLRDADNAIGTGEDDLLGSLDELEREQLWDLLRRLADSLELCPGAEVEECSKALSSEASG